MERYSEVGQPFSAGFLQGHSNCAACFVGSFAKNYTVQLLPKLRDDKGVPKS